jgi:hypothetical protein
MHRHLDLRWDTIPHDGAFAPIGIAPLCHGSEGDELLQAWSQERYECTEMRLYLEEANRLLKCILAEGGITLKNRRRARHLLLAIRAVRRDRRSDNV